MTVTAVSLPLTALWASASSANSPPNTSIREAGHLGGNAFNSGGLTPNGSAISGSNPLVLARTAQQNKAALGSESNITTTERFSISSHKEKDLAGLESPSRDVEMQVHPWAAAKEKKAGW